MKRLYRSYSDKRIAGVCGGVGAYFGVDPTVIRLGAALLCIATAFFPCIIGYIIAWVIIPEAPATLTE